MYWKLFVTWLLRFKNFFKTGIIYDFMESSHRQKDLIKNVKVKRRITKIDFTFKPFNLRIRKIVIYDDFDKIRFKNKQIDLMLDKQESYEKKL